MADIPSTLPGETSSPSESASATSAVSASTTSTSTSTSTSATSTTTPAPPTSASTTSPASSSSATTTTSKPNVSTPGSSSSSNSSASSSGSASSSSGSASMTLSSTLTAPMTTSVQETVMSTGTDGQVYTTVIETATVLSAGSVVTSPAASNNDNIASSSKSNTGEIVGGVIGGVGGLAIIFVVLFFIMKRQRRQKQLEESFDGNFDPDRIIRARGAESVGGSAGLRDSLTGTSETDGYTYAYAGGEKAKNKKAAKRASRTLEKDSSNGSREGTLPDIPVGGRGSLDRLRNGPSEMQQLGSTVTTSRKNLLDEEGMDDEPSASTPTTPSRTPFLDRSPTGTPILSPGPYGSSFPLLTSASSDEHGGMGPLPNGRPPSMTMSSSAHGHITYGPVPGYAYNRPPSFHGYNSSPYGGMGSPSPPGSPPPMSSYNLPPGAGYGPVNGHGYPGMQQGPQRTPSPGASAAYAGYASNAARRYSSGIPMEAFNNSGSGGGSSAPSNASGSPNAKRASYTEPMTPTQTLAVMNPT
ncbi:hypothetical protein D9757_011149 [Collybiopsis confluens]|uniref:Uncharacterized protein n=1 Tax=Collybiopsis confluens TaxID=2823264 RepID=A0A8H5H819_9AGAR|nr:hypothetical protein D9757_011149 [Collybiopsis confluens]